MQAITCLDFVPANAVVLLLVSFHWCFPWQCKLPKIIVLDWECNLNTRWARKGVRSPFSLISSNSQHWRGGKLCQAITIMEAVPTSPTQVCRKGRAGWGWAHPCLAPSTLIPGHHVCTGTQQAAHTAYGPMAKRNLEEQMELNVQMSFVDWFGQHNSPCLGKAMKWQCSEQETIHQFSAQSSNTICATTNTPLNFAGEVAYKINNNKNHPVL